MVSSVMATLVALVALVADVALVAVDALPLNVAVIVPAEKLPDASLATIVLAVLAFVAVVALFGMLVREAPEPLNVVDAKTPVEGLYVSLVLLTLAALLPLVLLLKVR